MIKRTRCEPRDGYVLEHARVFGVAGYAQKFLFPFAASVCVCVT